MNNSKNLGIVYKIITSKHLKEVIPITVEQFITRETMMRGLGATEDDFRAILRKEIPEWIKDGVSCGAWDCQTRQLVCANLSSVTPSGGKLQNWNLQESTNPKCQAFLEYEKLTEAALDIHKMFPTVKLILDMKFIFLLPSYSGRGISERILEMSEDVGRSKQCGLVFVEATGKASQGLLTKMGYKTIFEYSYDNLEVEGKKAFNLSAMGENLTNKMMKKML